MSFKKVAVRLCVTASLVAWVGFGIYTIHHASDHLTLPYAVGSFVAILGPLGVALILMST